MKYTYGEEIVYEYSLIEPGDFERLQAFSCGNDNLDRYICSEMLREGQVDAERFYLSDSIMCTIIKHCREISEKWVAAKYIILYADKKAKHFYERNLFSDFSEYMEKEKNMEICENDPMYMMLD